MLCCMVNSGSLCTCYSLLALGEHRTVSVHVTVSWLSVNSYSLCTCYSLLALGEHRTVSVHVTVSWLSVNVHVTVSWLSVNSVFAVLSCSLGELSLRVGDLVFFCSVGDLVFQFLQSLVFFQSPSRKDFHQTVPTLRCQYRHP